MDFVRWEKPWRIFTPDARDDGLLEFYGMGDADAKPVTGDVLAGQ